MYRNFVPLRSISVCVWILALPVNLRRRAERQRRMVVDCVSGRKKKKRRNTGAAIQRISHWDLRHVYLLAGLRSRGDGTHQRQFSAYTEKPESRGPRAGPAKHAATQNVRE